MDIQPTITLQFQLSPRTSVRMEFKGAPVQSEIPKLIALLELSQDTFPEDPQDEPAT